MSIQNWINISLSVITASASLIALFQSNKSIRLTESSIKEANRPYLSIYTEVIDTIYFSKHICLKNFGKTSAKIIDIKLDTIAEQNVEKINFQSLIGGVIAPNQKFTTSLDDDFKQTLVFSITYEELSGEQHIETQRVKTDMTSDLTWTSQKSSNDSKEATAIKHATHAIIKAFK